MRHSRWCMVRWPGIKEDLLAEQQKNILPVLLNSTRQMKNPAFLGDLLGTLPG